MLTRRQMIGAIVAPAVAPAAMASLRTGRHGHEMLAAIAGYRQGDSPADLATDEDYWAQIAKAFTVDRSMVNLNNGGVSPAPAFVQAAMKRHLDHTNMAPAYVMWDVLKPQRETVRARLARAFGADTEEIAITRNTSESLQICQFGFDLQAGDEVLTTTQDYPRMVNTFKQRQQREGVVLKEFSIPIPAEDDQHLIDLFEQHITPRTRLILMCHMINLTGQILPVQGVVAMARRHGIPVLVDGAHALAHFDFKIRDLDCDYYGTSLHKWLFAPIGTGLLYVRRDRIGDLWPLMAPPAELRDDIRKFEEIGTHPIANFLAIAEALTFHEGIGAARKQARMIHLRNSWANRLLEHHRVHLHTSLKPGRACGIANVQIDGIDSAELMKWLWEKHQIFTVAIKHDEFEGIRVSPSVYTTPQELERFCDAMEAALSQGIGATA